MIRVNLLPEELKKKETPFQKIGLSNLNLANVPVFKLAGGFLGVLVIISIILFFIGNYSKGYLAALNKRYGSILPKKNEADALKAQVAMIDKKVRAIDELMVKRFSWAKKLNDLSDSVTPGIWLTELTYEERVSEKATTARSEASPLPVKGKKAPQEMPRAGTEKVAVRYLIISGYASSMGEEGTASIGKFIKSLKDNANFYSDFSDIELGAIKRDKVEEQEVMSFKITCLFKE